MRVLRCAVYTRKSTEEGLDMAFNSLDAQREACEAYIASQKAEGWLLLPTAYDDGGFSGGSMERPGIKRLMEDVRAGKVDVIVVYKVDRLTRALSDFAKIVDVLDAAGASFVSVTQAFNTTTSMGRLTLNVLLSFAQFEREVIAERVRDKVAASRAKGMWMGGTVPFGYRVSDRKLVPIEHDAATVRHIYERYLALGSVRALKAELDAQGIYTKPRPAREGTQRPPAPFERGALYHLLSNPIYVGKVKHKTRLYDGEHEAIVPNELWDQVQTHLAERAMRKRDHTANGNTSLLTGRIRDHLGRVMSPTATRRAGRTNRYYASLRGSCGHNGTPLDDKAVRVGAAAMEKAIAKALQGLFTPDAIVRLVNEAAGGVVPALRPLLGRGMELCGQLQSGDREKLAHLIGRLDVRVVMGSDAVIADVDARAVLQLLDIRTDTEDDGVARRALDVPTEKLVRPRSTKLVFSGVASTSEADAGLIEMLARAQRMRDRLLAGEADPASRHARRMVRLAWLAPDIVKAIVDGRTQPGLTANKLLRMPGIPAAWDEQRAALGL